MTYITTSKQLDKSLEYLKSLQGVGYDLETTGLDPLTDKVLLIQVGNEYRQYVYDVYKLRTHIFKLLDWLKLPDTRKIAHNSKFEYQFTKSNFKIEIENIHCTMLGHQLLVQGRNIGSGLAKVAKKFLGVDLDKSSQKSFSEMEFGDKFDDDQIEYAGLDVKYLIPLYAKIQHLLAQRGMKELGTLEYDTARVLGDMELNGIYVDKPKWLALKTLAADTAAKAKKDLDNFFIPHCSVDLFREPIINYNSHQQIKPILEKIIGKPLENTNVNTLKSVRHEVIDALLEYRQATKRVTTYGEAFLNENVHKLDKRIHARFVQLGAKTGRMAGKEPNLMNIPKEAVYRAAFTSQHSDYKIIAADFSGQELRLLTQLSKEPKFTYALEQGMDLHSYSASLIYNRPYDDFLDPDTGKVWKKDPETDFLCDKGKEMLALRGNTKAINFGLIYGIGPTKLGKNLGLDLDGAKKLIKLYFKTFPKIKYTLDNLVADATKNKYNYSPLDKRRVDLSHVDWDNKGEVAHAMNEAKNLPFQGAGASTTKKALCLLKAEIDKKRLRC